MIMVVLTINVVVAPAMAECHCNHMVSSVDMAEMPCHNMDMADTGLSDDSEKLADKTSQKCIKCGCSDCKVPSQASLDYKPAYTDLAIGNAIHIIYSDITFSSIAYGIDNPPKYIS